MNDGNGNPVVALLLLCGLLSMLTIALIAYGYIQMSGGWP